MSRSAPASSNDIETWLAGLGRPVAEIQPLPGDVSPRRYTRVVFSGESEEASAILATYPPEARATCPRFLRTSELLTGAGARVPRILAADCDNGFMLVEDLGAQTLADWKDRPWSVLRLYFERALRLGERIARLPAESVADLNPRLDGTLLRRELKQTWDLYLEPHGLTGDGALTEALSGALDAICDRLGSGPAAPCHRDFMSRNLMPVDDQGGLAVLDHQDLRLGPAFYDLASLLNDTLFPPPEIEEELLATALPNLQAQTGETARTARSEYHRAAAQRTLKAVGTYTSFSLRGADRHLPLIGPTLSRCLSHLARIPEGEALAEDLGRLWQPVIEPAAR